ncbi:reverse transcriptase domain-containing protein [Tanacetum coccineum]
MISRWAMELEEHEIEFKPRNAIKAQILADFLAETQEEDDEIDFQNQKEKGKITRWKLYIDGASSSDATNNEAEYEAVIGLRIAKEMKIEEITVFVDSQLVANQVNRSYEAKHHHIKQYIQIAKELLKSFRRSEVQYIRRNQNKKADALSKLASLTLKNLTKRVLVKKLVNKLIYEKQVVETAIEEENSWMSLIIEYLINGILSADKQLARRVRVKASNYQIIVVAF